MWKVENRGVTASRGQARRCWKAEIWGVTASRGQARRCWPVHIKIATQCHSLCSLKKKRLMSIFSFEFWPKGCHKEAGTAKIKGISTPITNSIYAA